MTAPAAAPAPESAAAGRGFAVYVHWPFCLSKCPYCDFNSHVRKSIPEAAWRRALLSELDRFAIETKGRTVTSLFFGGGTPSLMGPDSVAAVIEQVRALWPVAADAEIGLEANPNSAEAARFSAFREAGVNRLSLGVQALDDRALKQLGRGHDRAEAIAAVERAARVFPRTSFDLIYGRQGQDVAAWRAELAEAIALAGEHLSVYELTIEPGTDFHRARVRPADEELSVALYTATNEALSRAGYAAYEVSNHAKPGGACRHNVTVWRYGDYVGVGPGAHGRLSLEGVKVATRQIRSPEAWLEAVAASGSGAEARENLSPRQRIEEMTLMGLRLVDGIAREDFLAETGIAIEAAFAPETLARLCDGGFLELDARGLRASAAGRYRLNAVTGALLG